MHHRLKSLSIRSWADELPKPRFSCLLPGACCNGAGPGPKKELADMNLISQHTNPGRSHRRMQQDRGWLAKLSRSTTLLPRLKSGILGLGAGPAGLLPGKTGFFFRAISCLHAVFVEFCSETQSQAITARFLVQISCSSRDGLLIGKIFDRGAALEFTNS